ncbi:MAG: CHAT domain-containing protein, partial [Kangiellaceae bacterium]|nr:CHAT domain-containing protein [Kangiellaceae bacterium]
MSISTLAQNQAPDGELFQYFRKAGIFRNDLKKGEIKSIKRKHKILLRKLTLCGGDEKCQRKVSSDILSLVSEIWRPSYSLDTVAADVYKRLLCVVDFSSSNDGIDRDEYLKRVQKIKIIDKEFGRRFGDYDYEKTSSLFASRMDPSFMSLGPVYQASILNDLALVSSLIMIDANERAADHMSFTISNYGYVSSEDANEIYINFIFKKAKYYQNKGCIDYMREALGCAEDLTSHYFGYYSEEMAHSLRRKAMFLRGAEDYDSALLASHEVLNIALSVGVQLDHLSIIQNEVSNCELYNGNVEAARQYILSALFNVRFNEGSEDYIKFILSLLNVESAKGNSPIKEGLILYLYDMCQQKNSWGYYSKNLLQLTFSLVIYYGSKGDYKSCFLAMHRLKKDLSSIQKMHDKEVLYLKLLEKGVDIAKGGRGNEYFAELLQHDLGSYEQFYNGMLDSEYNDFLNAIHAMQYGEIEKAVEEISLQISFLSRKRSYFDKVNQKYLYVVLAEGLIGLYEIPAAEALLDNLWSDLKDNKLFETVWMISKGMIDFGLGRLESADLWFQASEIYGETIPGLYHSTRSLSRLSANYRLGRNKTARDAASSFYRQVFDSSWQAMSSGLESELFRLIERYQLLLSSAVTIQLQLDKSFTGRASVVEAMLNHKGLATEAFFKRRQLTDGKTDQENALADIRGRIAHQLSDLPVDSSEEVSLVDLMTKWREAEYRFAGEIVGIDGQWIPLESVVEQLPDKAVYVEIMKTQIDNKFYYVAASTDSHCNLTGSILGEAAVIEKYLVEYENVLANQGAQALLYSVGNRLYEALLTPFRKLYPEMSMLYIAPDGPLHRVPWAALPAGIDCFLIEEMPVFVLNSGKDLLKQKRPSKSEDAVIVAIESF